MEKINIICVDDQPEVLDSVLRDLRPLKPASAWKGWNPHPNAASYWKNSTRTEN